MEMQERNNMNKLIVLFLALILHGSAMAQMEQVVRYEHPKEDEDDFFTTIACGEYGLLIVEEDHVRGKAETWIMTGLDTALNEMWELRLSIDYQYEFKAFDSFRENIYLIFQEADRVIADYRVVKINIERGTMVTFEVSNEIAFEMTNIIAIQDRIILGGYVRYSPTLLSYTIGESSFQVVPGSFKDKSDIVDLRANGEDTYNILTRESAYTGPFMRLRTYSYTSEMLFERTIEMDRNYEVIDGTSIGFVEGNIAVVGTYGARNSKYVQGLYFALVKPSGQENVIKYNDLSEFEHFFAYTDSERRAARLKEKAEQMSDRGKELKVGVRLYMHDVIKLDDSFLMVADVYDVRYDGNGINRYLTRPAYSMYDIRALPRGRYYYNDYQQGGPADYTTISYEYLAALAIDMDARGNIIWDNSILVEDKERFILDDLVDVYPGPDSLYMAYKDEEEIVYKGIPYSGQAVDESRVPITMKNPSDNLRSTTESETGELRHWYGNNFFVWGYQKINDRNVRGSEGRRDVIYINKLRFPEAASRNLME